jgi:hypothetical protein
MTRRNPTVNAVAELSMFGDRDVLQSTIKVTNAGDGLSAALAVEPAEYQLGEQVFVVLRTHVTRVGYEEIKDTGTLRRVHTLSAELGTIVDESFVSTRLAEQARKIEQAKGVERIPGLEDAGMPTDPDGASE